MISHSRSRTDENQAEIVRALEQVGAMVVKLHAVGDGCPDLLVGRDGRLVLMEVKREAIGKLTPAQKKFIAQANQRGLPFYVVKSVEEAISAIGVTWRKA